MPEQQVSRRTAEVILGSRANAEKVQGISSIHEGEYRHMTCRRLERPIEPFCKTVTLGMVRRGVVMNNDVSLVSARVFHKAEVNQGT